MLLRNFFLGLFLVITVAALAQTSGGDSAAGIPWRTDLEAARAEAREAGKPLLIVFR